MRFRAAALAVMLTAVAVIVPATAASADAIRNSEYWLDDFGVRTAWQTTRGAGVTVAVIDSGIDGSHPDLLGAVVGGTDVSGVGSPDGQTPVGETKSHGTLVASLIAGRGSGADRTSGVLGTAPEASLLSISVGFGVEGASTDTQIAEAVVWAVDHGADVINMSLTRNVLDWPQSWDDAFLYAFDNDVVVVAAAGNRASGTTVVGAPATIPGVLTVAGVNQAGISSFNASSQGVTIAVAAPSEGLVGATPGGGYSWWQGTSGAAPIVSGIVALIRSAHPELDANSVIQRVIATADAKGSTVPDATYGYGLVDAAGAVSASVPVVTSNPLGDLKEWIRVYRQSDSGEPEVLPEVQSPEIDPPVTEPEPERSFWDSAVAAWPTAQSMRSAAAPIAVYVGFGVLALLAALGAWRHFRRVRTR
jgi:subtilisin family serine protease